MDLYNEWIESNVNLLSVIAYRREMSVLCCANKDDGKLYTQTDHGKTRIQC